MNERTIKFLGEFNRIEKHLKASYGSGLESFSTLVRRAKKTNYIIQREYELISSLRKLRNVMVHESGQTIIAIPSEEALKEIQRIANSLIKPTKVYDVIGHNFVKVKSHDTLSETLKLMKKHDYSKIPVYDGKQYKGLLTGNTVIRWMANNMDDQEDIVQSLNDIYLKDLLDYNKAKDDVGFVDRDILVSELMTKIAENPSGSGTYIMTQNGKQNEKPLAIITDHDYSKLELSI